MGEDCSRYGASFNANPDAAAAFYRGAGLGEANVSAADLAAADAAGETVQVDGLPQSCWRGEREWDRAREVCRVLRTVAEEVMSEKD